MQQDQTDRELAAQLFGQPGQKRCVGGCVIDGSSLKVPLEWGVMRAFCEGCGTLGEINQDLAKSYARALGVDLPSPLRDYYLLRRSCSSCDGNDAGAEFRKIPD